MEEKDINISNQDDYVIGKGFAIENEDEKAKRTISKGRYQETI